jgi:hypothetical protein
VSQAQASANLFEVRQLGCVITVEGSNPRRHQIVAIIQRSQGPDTIMPHLVNQITELIGLGMLCGAVLMPKTSRRYQLGTAG